jgi:hypothetical protein
MLEHSTILAQHRTTGRLPDKSNVAKLAGKSVMLTFLLAAPLVQPILLRTSTFFT